MTKEICIAIVKELQNFNQTKCPRANCSALLVTKNEIMVAGINCSPIGEPNCKDTNCIMENNHCVRVQHAEINAVAAAARTGLNLDGATAYVSQRPCNRCMGILSTAGIQEVFYLYDYHSENHAQEYCSADLKSHLRLTKYESS